MTDIEQRLEALDGTLFAGIPSQSSENDRRSLLACQLAVRRLAPGYCYLEIGSHLGGSIQPHLLDDQCIRIYSLDSRPSSQPDARGQSYRYPNNSTERMLDLLRRIHPDGVSKVVCIDGDSRHVSPEAIATRPRLCFIDGEHTDQAAIADFRFAAQVLARDGGAIVFHDAQVIYNGLAAIVEQLRKEGRRFHAYNLPDVVFVFELDDFPLHATPRVQALLLDNHHGYLGSLRANDHYRRFANRTPFRWARRLWGYVLAAAKLSKTQHQRSPATLD